MKASDIMTKRVISVTPQASILEAARQMLQNRISGLPVIDDKGTLVGIVTEGDFLRRRETGTERKRPRWLEFFTGPSRLADEYVHSHGRKVEEVMSPDPLTITENTPVEEIVRLMEERRIKRLPVVRRNEVVGIVSRANLLHALAGFAREAPPPAKDDQTIRERVLAELGKATWAPRDFINVTVRNGVVELWGVVIADNQRQAAAVCAENVPGVKQVMNHLAWVEPMSGMVIYQPDDNSKPKTAA